MRVAHLPVLVGAVWVLLSIAIFMFAIVASRGTDPSACGTCPAHWQQQMILREAAP